MARFMDTETDALIEELGDVSVTVGATTGKALKDVVGQLGLEGEAGDEEDERVTVVVKTGVFGALVPGVSIVVDGQPYVVQSALPIEDGGLTRVICSVL